jgi:bifunctional DNA-binding transcriptional regulator/antitoxin component of YhaV-PrlF toxin-antitoxin module
MTEGKTLIEQEMKVGPKGDVVIPRTMRKALKIEP